MGERGRCESETELGNYSYKTKDSTFYGNSEDTVPEEWPALQQQSRRQSIASEGGLRSGKDADQLNDLAGLNSKRTMKWHKFKRIWGPVIGFVLVVASFAAYVFARGHNFKE